MCMYADVCVGVRVCAYQGRDTGEDSLCVYKRETPRERGQTHFKGIKNEKRTLDHISDADVVK